MNVRVMPEGLTPGMEHNEEADLRAADAWGRGQCPEEFGAGPEQQIVEELLVLPA